MHQSREIWGHPFGAGHAVPNFYKRAAWLKELTRKLLFCHIDQFFDDFWVIEPCGTSVGSLWSFRQITAACSYVLDPKKAQLPTDVWDTLGINF